MYIFTVNALKVWLNQEKRFFINAIVVAGIFFLLCTFLKFHCFEIEKDDSNYPFEGLSV